VSPLDVPAFRAAKLTTDPFPFVVLPGFVRLEAMPELLKDYPSVPGVGSFPWKQVPGGPAFNALVAALRGPEFRDAVAEKFDLDLRGRPTMVTVRGQSGLRDGHIHTDSKSKLITVLLYLNPEWEDQGGRLRLLRSATDLNDVVAEVPPHAGTLIAFKRTDNSWHGHAPFVGQRKVVQLNWVKSHWTAAFETFRHRLSGWVKWAKSAVGGKSRGRAA
jgi:SM-20-related protein